MFDHLVAEFDGVEHRLRVRRAMADDAHAVDTEQHRASVGIRADLGIQREQRRQQGVGVRLVVLFRGERLEQRRQDDPHAALERLQHDVAGEPVGHDHIGRLAHHVAALDVADEADAGGVRHQLECLFAQGVALAGLLADRQQTDRRAIDPEAVNGHRPSPSDRTAPAIRAAPRRWRRRRAGWSDRARALVSVWRSPGG